MQKPLSILLVDDEEELSTLFKNFVNAIGISADSFTNPINAFEHFMDNRNKYSLIITDFRMPGMCGLELATKIRVVNSFVKIFLMSAFDVTNIESHPLYQSAKIDRLLEKPIKFAALRKLVEQAITK